MEPTPGTDPAVATASASSQTHEAQETAPLRVIFMGTPDFAAIILRRLLQWPGAQVVAVYTQPDRPSGRGQRSSASPVKVLAQERGLPVVQPLNFKNDEAGNAAVEQLRAFEPDVLAVAAYGLILPQRVLDIPRRMPINVHGSLLPKYRGAAPIQRALLAGERVTGITIMRMEAGLDSGPMLLSRALKIAPTDTAQSLHDELAALGGEMLVDALGLLAQGRLAGVPQDHAQATHAPKLTKEEGQIDWNQPAREIHNRVRAMHPWPGAYFYLESPGREPLRLAIQPGLPAPGALPQGTVPGTILGLEGGRLAIACADRAYLIAALTPQGKKQMTAEAFWCGYAGKCEPRES